MNVEKLLAQLDKFIDGEDVSIQWAKETETILDEISDSQLLCQHEIILDRLQEKLSLYRPGGGDHLVDEESMKSFCTRMVAALQSSELNS